MTLCVIIGESCSVIRVYVIVCYNRRELQCYKGVRYCVL